MKLIDQESMFGYAMVSAVKNHHFTELLNEPRTNHPQNQTGGFKNTNNFVKGTS